MPLAPDTIDGTDFSHYQGAIDWHQVKAAGIDFAYGKVIEGTDYPDATWPANRAGAIAAGIPVGGYYWAHPNLDPEASATAFLAHLDQAPGMLQPILDIEHNGSPNGPAGAGGRTPTQIHGWIHTFRDIVQAAGYRLDIYTGGWWWDPFVGPAAANCTECASSRLYLSRYASTMGPVPKPWTHASVWQWTETGHVPGIAGLVDRDRLVGEELLADLIYAGTVPDPTNGEDIPVDQTEFNKLMDGYYNAKTPALRASLDKYFETRIPDPAHPTPGSISERLAGRTFAVISNPKVDGSLSSINSKIAQLLPKTETPADTLGSRRRPGRARIGTFDDEVPAWPPFTVDDEPADADE